MHYPSRETWVSLYEHMEHTQNYQILGSVNAPGCASLAIRRDVLERIGPLPVNAYSWEDWDIDVRLMQAGETNVFVPAARLLTDRPATVREYWQNNVRCQRAHLAGLWYHRQVFLSRPAWGFYEVLIYFVSFGVFLALAAAVVLAILFPEYRQIIAQLVALGMLWIGAAGCPGCGDCGFQGRHLLVVARLVGARLAAPPVCSYGRRSPRLSQTAALRLQRVEKTLAHS